MKISSLFAALCILPAFLVVFGSARGFSNDFKTVPARFSHGAHQQQRSFNTSIAKEINTALAATVNGTVYLLDVESLKPLWSFSFGWPIYSSYHKARIGSDNDDNEYYIDCGDDWELYVHTRLGKVKLAKTIEEYASSTPIDEDGGIVLSSKQTSAFLVDGKTGRLIDATYGHQVPRSYSSYATQYGYQKYHAVDYDALYFTRTDYTLASVGPKFKTRWNLTVAEIVVASICRDTEDSLDEAHSDSGSSGGAVFNMPLPCQSQGIVRRFQNEDVLEAFFVSRQLAEANHLGMVIPAQKSKLSGIDGLGGNERLLSTEK